MCKTIMRNLLPFLCLSLSSLKGDTTPNNRKRRRDNDDDDDDENDLHKLSRGKQ